MKDTAIGRWKWPFRRKPEKEMIFGVGAAKTGTHSVASLLNSAGIVAAHEPDCRLLIQLIASRASGKICIDTFRASVKIIIDKRALDANVSQINGYMIGDLFPIYPTAKYILTVRDAESWVLSFLNHALTRPMDDKDIWHQFRSLRFDRGMPYNENDENLRRNNLQSLDSYLSYWVEHSLNVVAIVPESQLLILATSEISEKPDKIARFLKIERPLAAEHGHAYKGTYLEQHLLDPSYLKERCTFFTKQLFERAQGRITSHQMETLQAILTRPNGWYYAKSPQQRIARSENLKMRQTTDIERWENISTESDERWEGRARLVSTMVLGQSSVVDLGCGSMLIERYLESTTRYLPVDVVRRDARTIVWDINAKQGRLPPGLNASCIVALGLLEYIHDVPTVLANMARDFNCIVCSYLPIETVPSIEQRRATGWVNDFSVNDLENAFAEAGLIVERQNIYRDLTFVWKLGRIPSQ